MTKPCWIVIALLSFLCQMAAAVDWRAAVSTHCLDCHDRDSEKGGIDLETSLDASIADSADVWEKALRQIQARQMPPIGKKRPSEAEYLALTGDLTNALDYAAAEHPNPGRTDSIRRLTRTEYGNSIRDLLGLEIDTATLLPADESSHGFDNVTVGSLSPALLDRYLSSAQKISRLAAGIPRSQPDGRTIRIRPDITQEEHVVGLPLGTRGGALIPHHFPETGEYEVRVRLARDRNEMVEGLKGKHQLEILLDKKSVASLEVKPAPDPADHTQVDAKLVTRFQVVEGQHQVGVTFRKWPSSVPESLRQPYGAHFNFHRHPRISPAVYQISITGPYKEDSDDEPDRAKGPDDEKRAEAKLRKWMRRAYRRPVSESDVERIMEFYREEDSFAEGIESALAAILVSRDFLFRVEEVPRKIPPGTPYSLDGFALASRLSFFLWSSLPDEELLRAAERGTLTNPDELGKQTRRMIADPRSDSLVSNFADQWLYLRNLDSITPDARLFPDFDDNLRQAFREETSLLFADILKNDRSVLDLIDTEETFLNERLAHHYGIPHVYGTRFRKVDLSPDSERGGILRHGSLLTVTSYATRTSPVIRGHWILKNLLGTPPPPPPPDVPALDENSVSANLPVRERLAQHRENAACASCHRVMDPIGFALENFDAVGRWREFEDGSRVDSEGGFPDGSEFSGVAGLEERLLARPEIFARTVSEKLLTYALGRGVETSDAPTIREVLRDAEPDRFRLSDLIVGLVKSPAFTMRLSE